MTALKYSVGLSLCVFWEQEVTWSQGWWNACAPDLTCCEGGKVWSDMQGSELCMCKSVCARARNICVGQRTENHEVGEGGVRCWCGMNSRQGLLSLHRACQLLVAVAWAMAGELWGMLGNYILLLGSWMEEKGVDGFSLSISFLYSAD